MSTPTPDPRPEWITAAAEAIEEAAWPRIGRDLGTVHRDEIVAAGLRAALAKVAYEIRAELVCCDVYDRDANTDRAGERHAICFWSEAAARIVEQRPDAPAEPAVEPSAVPVEGSGQGPAACPSCGATIWPAATPWTDDYRRLVLGRLEHPDRPVLSLDTPEGATDA